MGGWVDVVDEFEEIQDDGKIDQHEAKLLMTPGNWRQVKVEKAKNYEPIIETVKEEEFKQELETKNWNIANEDLTQSVVADRARFLMEPPERSTIGGFGEKIETLISQIGQKDDVQY